MHIYIYNFQQIWYFAIYIDIDYMYTIKVLGLLWKWNICICIQIHTHCYVLYTQKRYCVVWYWNTFSVNPICFVYGKCKGIKKKPHTIQCYIILFDLFPHHHHLLHIYNLPSNPPSPSYDQNLICIISNNNLLQ